MRKLNKLVAAALAVAMAVSITACGNTEKTITIGVAQLVTHPSLDASLKGFQQALADEGFVEGKNVKYDIQNAQGEQTALPSRIPLPVKSPIWCCLLVPRRHRRWQKSLPIHRC